MHSSHCKYWGKYSKTEQDGSAAEQDKPFPPGQSLEFNKGSYLEAKQIQLASVATLGNQGGFFVSNFPEERECTHAKNNVETAPSVEKKVLTYR